MNILFGLFLVAHGAVYGLYAAHAKRLFELKPGLTWPDGSWAFSRLIGDSAVRLGVAVLFSLVALGLIVSGMALMARQPWWGLLASATAIVSTAAFLPLWNGQLRELDAQGAYAILINVGIVVSALVLHWPKFAR